MLDFVSYVFPLRGKLMQYIDYVASDLSYCCFKHSEKLDILFLDITYNINITFIDFTINLCFV